MINLNNKFDKFKNGVMEKNPCAEAIEWMNSVDGDKYTLQEAIDLYMTDPEGAEAWAHWVVMEFYKEVDDEVMLEFINKISDPMLARRLEIAGTYLKEKHVKKLQ